MPDLEDYKYDLSSVRAFDIDIAGLAETNTAWQQIHLEQAFRKLVQQQYRQSKLRFGAPMETIDPCSPSEVYQSGGMLSMINGPITSSIYGSYIIDPTGLARWSGITIRGTDIFKLSVFTAYRTCGGNIKTSSIGSVFSQEFFFVPQEYLNRALDICFSNILARKFNALKTRDTRYFSCWMQIQT